MNGAPVNTLRLLTIKIQSALAALAAGADWILNVHSMEADLEIYYMGKPGLTTCLSKRKPINH